MNKTRTEIDKILRNEEEWIVSDDGDFCHECKKGYATHPKPEGGRVGITATKGDGE